MQSPSVKHIPRHAPGSEKLAPITVSPAVSILQALKKMDELRVKLLLVMENQRFQGVLSIGDIQQALIKNINLEKGIAELLRKDIILANTREPVEDIRNRMLQY